MNIHTQPSDCEAEIAAGAQAPCKVFLEWPLLSGWGDVRFSQNVQLLPEVDQWGVTTETDTHSLRKTKIIVFKFQKRKEILCPLRSQDNGLFQLLKTNSFKQCNHIIFSWQIPRSLTDLPFYFLKWHWNDVNKIKKNKCFKMHSFLPVWQSHLWKLYLYVLFQLQTEFDELEMTIYHSLKMHAFTLDWNKSP